MKNKDIRDFARIQNVKLWEIADKLGLQDSNFSRKLRHELPGDEKEIIFLIIKELAEGSEANDR